MNTPVEIVPLMIACNDPENGSFDGILRGIQLGNSEILDLECCIVDEEDGFELDGLDIEVTSDNNYLKVKSETTYTVPLLGRKSWVGNWCWDCVLVDLSELTKFLNWLMQTNTFWCVAGVETLYSAWHDMKPFTADLLKEVLSHETHQQ